MSGEVKIAILFLMFSGFCDMWDGKVARYKDKRTKQAKLFGIQIDSLSDIICFGVFPALLNYQISNLSIFSSNIFYKIFSIVISCIYVLAALIRLGYYNVEENNRQKSEGDARKHYTGLPVTTSALIFPISYVFCFFTDVYFPLIFNFIFIIVSLLFILNFKIGKLGVKAYLVIVAFSLMLAFGFIFLV